MVIPVRRSISTHKFDEDNKSLKTLVVTKSRTGSARPQSCPNLVLEPGQYDIYQRERPRNQSFPAASPTSTRRAGSTVSKSSKKHSWSSRSKKTKPTNYSRPRKSVDSSRRSQNSSSLRSSGTSKSWNPCRPLWSPRSRKSKSGSRSTRGSTRTARSGRSKKSARSQSSRSKRRNIRQRKSESLNVMV